MLTVLMALASMACGLTRDASTAFLARGDSGANSCARCDGRGRRAPPEAQSRHMALPPSLNAHQIAQFTGRGSGNVTRVREVRALRATSRKTKSLRMDAPFAARQRSRSGGAAG